MNKSKMSVQITKGGLSVVKNGASRFIPKDKLIADAARQAGINPKNVDPNFVRLDELRGNQCGVFSAQPNFSFSKVVNIRKFVK